MLIKCIKKNFNIELVVLLTGSGPVLFLMCPGIVAQLKVGWVDFQLLDQFIP